MNGSGLSDSAPLYRVAVHAFAPRTADELLLQRGDRIVVIETDDEFQDGWYMGLNLSTNASGLFPKDYTTSLPADDTIPHPGLAQAAPISNAPATSSPGIPSPVVSPSASPVVTTSVHSPIMSSPTGLTPSGLIGRSDPLQNSSPANHSSVYDAFNDVEDALHIQSATSQMNSATNVSLWTPTEVSRYFALQGFDSDVCSKFIEHKITGNILLELDLALLKELEIASFGTRFQVNKVIDSLRKAPQASYEVTPVLRSSNTFPQVSPSSAYNYQPYPVDTGDRRSRVASNEPVRMLDQPSHVLDSPMDGKHHSGMPSFDRNWQLPQSPGQQSAAQSPPVQQVSPLIPINQRMLSAEELNSTNSPIEDEFPESAENADDTIVFTNNQSFRASVVSQDTQGYRDSNVSLVNPVYRESVSTSARSTTSFPQTPDLNQQQFESEPYEDSSVDPSTASQSASSVSSPSAPTKKEMYQQQYRSLINPDLVPEEKIIPMGDPHYPDKYPQSGASRLNSENTPISPDLSNLSQENNGNLNSRALKGRNVQSSPKRTHTDPISRLTTLSHEEKAASTLRSASATYAKPKKLTKQNTSAFTEGLKNVSPTQSSASADHFGWMYKRGNSSVGVWKNRFFILHGTRLSYFSSKDDQKEKGLIDITAHKVVPADSAEDKFLSFYTASTGRYCFKLVPPSAGSRKGVVFTAPKVHYFAVDTWEDMRLWMRALIRATIDRDDSQEPVISSYSTPTVSLAKARELNALAMEARAEELRMSLTPHSSESHTTTSTQDGEEIGDSTLRDSINGMRDLSIN
ncbi:uncharacterized protein V1516DRAFT_707586 [Lipomyces oligophaga]|uniref:uncharacterized protein n=1 Tax=Lipomyces oligophaga TaxID=45792 RepID=UPI0034CF457B